MGNVEASVAGVVLVGFGLAVAADMVAEEVARIADFAIAAHTQAVRLVMFGQTVCRMLLCTSRQAAANQ